MNPEDFLKEMREEEKRAELEKINKRKFRFLRLLVVLQYLVSVAISFGVTFLIGAGFGGFICSIFSIMIWFGISDTFFDEVKRNNSLKTSDLFFYNNEKSYDF